jgi:hypothetical protein
MHPAPERLAYPLGPGLVLALEIGAESREPAPPV